MVILIRTFRFEHWKKYYENTMVLPFEQSWESTLFPLFLWRHTWLQSLHLSLYQLDTILLCLANTRSWPIFIKIGNVLNNNVRGELEMPMYHLQNDEKCCNSVLLEKDQRTLVKIHANSKSWRFSCLNWSVDAIKGARRSLSQPVFLLEKTNFTMFRCLFLLS